MTKRTTEERVERTLRKLAKKRATALEWLRAKGVDTSTLKTDVDILRAAYLRAGIKWRCTKPITRASSLHGHYAAVVGKASMPPAESTSIADGLPTARKRTVSDARRFYESYEWRKLRYTILQRDGAKCLACGADRQTGTTLHVDHILPLRKHWDKRLDPENLQTLCSACNHGKGNWDTTDWRAQPLSPAE